MNVPFAPYTSIKVCQPEIMMGVLPERELAFPSVLAVQHLRRGDRDRL